MCVSLSLSLSLSLCARARARARVCVFVCREDLDHHSRTQLLEKANTFVHIFLQFSPQLLILMQLSVLLVHGLLRLMPVVCFGLFLFLLLFVVVVVARLRDIVTAEKKLNMGLCSMRVN